MMIEFIRGWNGFAKGTVNGTIGSGIMATLVENGFAKWHSPIIGEHTVSDTTPKQSAAPSKPPLNQQLNRSRSKR